MAEKKYQDMEDDFSDEEQHEGFSRRRIILIVSVVVLIAILIFVFLNIRNNKKKQNQVSLANGQVITLNNASGEYRDAQIASEKDKTEKEEQEKKKKRKIKYDKLFSQLTGEQTARVCKELTFHGVAFKTEQKGKTFDLLVDRQMVEDARTILALKGLPSGGNKGYEIFDNAQNLGVTDFDKRIRLIRAISGELENAIMEFTSISDAKVQVVMPERRLFAVSQPPVTASVLIRKAQNATITDEIVYGIIQLVANAVENLQPENISVIDTEGRVLSTGIFERIAEKRRRDALSSGVYYQEYQSEVNSDGMGDSAMGERLPDELGSPSSVSASDSPFGSESEASQVAGKTEAVSNGKTAEMKEKELNNYVLLKEDLDRSLEKNATEQLVGVLPPGAFKIASTTELDAVKDGAPVIRKITTSVIIDSGRKDVSLVEKKKEVFDSVAGAIGYVKGRDTINITLADFSLMPPAERQQLEASMAAIAAAKGMKPASAASTPEAKKIKVKKVRKPTSWKPMLAKVGHVAKISLKYLLIISVIAGIGGGLYYFIAKRKQAIGETEFEVEDDLQNTDDLAQFEPQVADETKVEQLRAIAASNPDLMAYIIAQWSQQPVGAGDRK